MRRFQLFSVDIRERRATFDDDARPESICQGGVRTWFKRNMSLKIHLSLPTYAVKCICGIPFNAFLNLHP